MNKLFTKIAGISLGLALAMGIGVVAYNKDDSFVVRATSSPVNYTSTSFGSNVPTYWTGTGGGSYCGGYGKNKDNAWSVALDFDSATGIDWSTVDFSKTVSLNSTVTAAGNSSSGNVVLSLNNGAGDSKTLSIGSFGSGSNASSAKATAMNITSVSGKFSTITINFPAKSFITKYSCTLTFTEKEAGVLYSVTDSVEHGALSADYDVSENEPLNIYVVPDEHYHLPDDLTVTMGGNTLTNGVGYTFDSSTGEFSISKVTGDVVITGSCIEDDKVTVTYIAGENGSGTNYVVSNQYVGSYTLLNYSVLSAAGFKANSGYVFKCFTVNETDYNPGEEISISESTNVIVNYKQLPSSLVINKDTLKKTSSTAGYAGYDGTRSVDGYDVLTNNVMIQDSKVQFRKSTSAYLCNSSSFDYSIKLIRMSGCSGTIKVSFDDDTAGTSGSSIGTVITATTVGSFRYYIPSINNAKFFHIVSANSDTATFSSIEIYDYKNAALAFANDFVNAMEDDSVCGTSESQHNANNKTAVSAIWGTYKTGFEALTADTKTEFGSSENAKIAQARALYLHCVSRYNLTVWSNGPVASSNLGINHNITENYTVLIVVIIAVAGLASAGAYFLSRKKKHQ